MKFTAEKIIKMFLSPAITCPRKVCVKWRFRFVVVGVRGLNDRIQRNIYVQKFAAICIQGKEF